MQNLWALLKLCVQSNTEICELEVSECDNAEYTAIQDDDD